MPTTYTNGLKLPDLGSIDWYNAYKNNIDILDPIVGTVNGVATTYAPISHNHDASEITSGTIDIARLPPAALERLTTVADQTARYALTTSTVQLGDTVKQLDTGIMYLVVDTTKLNSADGYVEYSVGTASKAIADEDGTSIKTGYVNVAGNQTVTGQKTWSDTNTFSKTNSDAIRLKNGRVAIGETISSDAYTQLVFQDKNTDNLAYIRNMYAVDGANTLDFFVRNKYTSGSPSTTGSVVYSYFGLSLDNTGKTYARLKGDFYPYSNNSYALGSSSYQWSSVYAQTYYYNGTAWGLDKSNVWSGENTYTNTYLTQKQTGLEEGELPTSNQTRRFRFTDKNNASLGWLQHRVNTSGDSALELLVVNKFSNGQLSTQGSEVLNSIVVGLHGDGSRFLTTLGDVYPDLPTRVCNLGTSTNKWKTLNGVNPGALGIPNKDNKVDIASEFTNLTGGNNYYIPPADGFVSINADTDIYCAVVSSTHNTAFWRQSAVATSTGYASVTIPVRAGLHLLAKIKSTTAIYAEFFPCLGNV